MASVQQAEAITSGELDLGLLRVPLPARWPQLHYRSLPRERLMVALTAGHPLAADSSVPIIRLAKIPLVMVSRHLEPASHDQIIQLCHKAGFQPRVEAQEDQVGSVLGLVAAGVGVAIGPESLSRLRRDDVEYRLLAPRTFIPSLAVCHDRRAPTPIQRNFENVLRSITLPAS
jgi:DNA-binding transcriptional LysR family regulator